MIWAGVLNARIHDVYISEDPLRCGGPWRTHPGFGDGSTAWLSGQDQLHPRCAKDAFCCDSAGERRGTGLWRSPDTLMGNIMVRSPIIAAISWDMTCTITAIHQLITVSRTASTTSLIVAAAQGRCRGIGSWCEKRWCWCENGRAVVLLVGITWF